MRQEDLGTYEMLWDCPNCGTQGLLGLTHRHCPSCGSAQDPTTRYFPDESKKVAVENHVYTGADWRCGACDTPNASRADFCANCGSPKDNSKEVRQRTDMVSDAAGGFSADTGAAARQELQKRAQAPHQVPSSDLPRSKSNIGKYVLMGIGALIVVLLIVAFWKKEAMVEVSGNTWSREIEVESFKPKSDSAWREQVPFGAYSVMCSQEVRSHRQIPDGETCRNRRVDKGDGTYKDVRECTPKYRSEPVYDSRCRYMIDVWQLVRTEKAEGASLADAPHWPTVTLSRTGSCLGCEREGARSQHYVVHFIDTQKVGKTYQCDFPQPRWESLKPGLRFKSKAGVLSGNLDCELLLPQ